MIDTPRENDDQIALSSGETVHLGAAMTCYKMIEGMIRHRPDEFGVLLRAHRGERPLPEGDVTRDLREADIVSDDGRLTPLYHTMFSSAVVEPESGVFDVVNPCLFGSAESRRWEDEERRFEQNLIGHRAPQGGPGSRR
ncbi:MAG: hypothetical protein K2V38_18670 [Gemmataceae bacterium]|nr:hypothetical protein [Gemmataceae bacterium]